MTDEELLHAEVRKVVDGLRHAAIVGPAAVATQVMCAIKFKPELHRLGYAGCHLQVRQMARGVLRRDFDPEERVAASVEGEDDLFPETLQDRYPRRGKHGEEPVYVLREQMTGNDVGYNVARMRRGGRALLKHADALEAWDHDRPRAAA